VVLNLNLDVHFSIEKSLLSLRPILSYLAGESQAFLRMIGNLV